MKYLTALFMISTVSRRISQFRTLVGVSHLFTSRTPSSPRWISEKMFVDSEAFRKANMGAARIRILINDSIHAPIVRVIDKKGFVGDMSSVEGIELAKERGHDLILIDPAAAPPVCMMQPLAEFLEEQQGKWSEHSSPALNMNSPMQAQYSFDPSAKTFDMTFSAIEQDNAFIRKVLRARKLLKQGHKLEISLERRGVSANQCAERAIRLVSELKDLSKPVGLPVDIAAYAKSAINFKMWPCTPEQAAAFRLPVIRMTHIADDISDDKRIRLKETFRRRHLDYRRRG